ncbi:MAG: adenylosuccinate lyase [Candidatus Saccharibacteria bacterium]|nr:adenylosuccinate lyase [Candidatus Saccharibacteria bacterium]
MKVPLTPLDGRYYDRITELTNYLSENALIKYRVFVEIEWLKYLLNIVNKTASNELHTALDKLFESFTDDSCEEIRNIEAKTKHDVKAVEIWIGNKLKDAGHVYTVPYIHFGRTSDDINNVAYALMLRDARKDIVTPNLNKLVESLNVMGNKYSGFAMLARTHGQPATPTTFGKEMAVFGSRLTRQIINIENVEILAKFSGATGTYAADVVAYPDVNWPEVMNDFISSLDLVYNPITTQIEPHDWIARLNNELSLSGTILTDLCRDMWQYISVGYVKQIAVAGEVGSSTMPHKVNPIDFENAESNFGIANALFNHLSAKLPISRLQRDLSDSSALRSLSEAYGHYLLALKSLQKGLSKIEADPNKMLDDLKDQWELLTEAIQTVMRKNDISDAYDQMKQLARDKTISKEQLHDFINNLEIDNNDKQRLLELSPENYLGLSKILH